MPASFGGGLGVYKIWEDQKFTLPLHKGLGPTLAPSNDLVTIYDVASALVGLIKLPSGRYYVNEFSEMTCVLQVGC